MAEVQSVAACLQAPYLTVDPCQAQMPTSWTACLPASRLPQTSSLGPGTNTLTSSKTSGSMRGKQSSGKPLQHLVVCCRPPSCMQIHGVLARGLTHRLNNAA